MRAHFFGVGCVALVSTACVLEELGAAPPSAIVYAWGTAPGSSNLQLSPYMEMRLWHPQIMGLKV